MGIVKSPFPTSLLGYQYLDCSFMLHQIQLIYDYQVPNFPTVTEKEMFVVFIHALVCKFLHSIGGSFCVSIVIGAVKTMSNTFVKSISATFCQNLSLSE